jgi:hypothetical protein
MGPPFTNNYDSCLSWIFFSEFEIRKIGQLAQPGKSKLRIICFLQAQEASFPTRLIPCQLLGHEY